MLLNYTELTYTIRMNYQVGDSIKENGLAFPETLGRSYGLILLDFYFHVLPATFMMRSETTRLGDDGCRITSFPVMWLK